MAKMISKISNFIKKLFGIGKKKVRESISRDNRKALVIGIETSVQFGACPGARRDSVRMRNLLTPICSEISVLQDKEATKANISKRMKELIAKIPEDGIFIMTYSGHGGSEKFPGNTDEKDGKDEFLCCYDTYLKDDDIWEMTTKCRGKVFLVFDCCHSETMYRTPIAPPKGLMKDNGEICGIGKRDAVIPDSPVEMLVWSGCPDNTYSYGDSSGGLFTNSFLSALKSGKTTYDEIWRSIKSDKTLNEYSQKPQKTILGGFNTNNEIWN